MKIKEFVFLSCFFSCISHTESVSGRIISVAPIAGCSWGRKAQKPHTALFTAAVSRFCLISDSCPWKGLDRGQSPIIFITEDEQISLLLSLFHIKMSGETEEKQRNFRWEGKTRSTAFHGLFSSSEMFKIPYLSALSRLFIQYWPVAVVVI